MDRREELSYPMSFYRKQERRKPSNCAFKTCLPNPLRCLICFAVPTRPSALKPKVGLLYTCTPSKLAERGTHSRLSQCWLSFRPVQGKPTASWKRTSMHMYASFKRNDFYVSFQENKLISLLPVQPRAHWRGSALPMGSQP